MRRLRNVCCHTKIEALKNFALLFGELHLLCVSGKVAKEFASLLQLEPSQLQRQHHCTSTEVLSAKKSTVISQIKQ